MSARSYVYENKYDLLNTFTVFFSEIYYIIICYREMGIPNFDRYKTHLYQHQSKPVLCHFKISSFHLNKGDFSPWLKFVLNLYFAIVYKADKPMKAEY